MVYKCGLEDYKKLCKHLNHVFCLGLNRTFVPYLHQIVYALDHGLKASGPSEDILWIIRSILVLQLEAQLLQQACLKQVVLVSRP